MSYPSRADWFERNGNTVFINYAADNIAPHAATNRATYAAPSGKKALVTRGIVKLTRQTAAGTPGRPEIIVWDGTNTLLQARMIENSNVQGDKDKDSEGFCAFLDGGDQLIIRTFDDSLTGTISYIGALYIREFDA